MKMTQEQAVLMLTEIGYKTSNKWDLEHINLKLAKLQDQLDGTEEMETDEGKKLLAKALKALKAGEEVVAEAGEAEEVEEAEEAAPAKKSKKAAKEEVAEEEAPAAKPAKKKAKAAPAEEEEEVEEKPAKKAAKKPAKEKAESSAEVDAFGTRLGTIAAKINACVGEDYTSLETIRKALAKKGVENPHIHPRMRKLVAEGHVVYKKGEGWKTK
jgi:hypothetical protein